MPQVKRLPEDPRLFEQLLLTRAIAVIAGQPELMQLPSRERVQSLLTDDEIETAVENAAVSAGEFVRRAKENGEGPMPAEVKEWRELYFGAPTP